MAMTAPGTVAQMASRSALVGIVMGKKGFGVEVLEEKCGGCSAQSSVNDAS